MARRSLRPHLNQIRAWVRQGRTDAWVAHQLEVTVQEIEQFKRQNELVGDDEPTDGAARTADYPEEIDLRAEDDALIAAELEAARCRGRAREGRRSADASEAPSEEDEQRGRRRPAPPARPPRWTPVAPALAARPLEGTFDHGEEGYGLWLDPAIQDNPIYAEHWAGHRPVEVTVEEDQIVIRRERRGRRGALGLDWPPR